jgi:AmiR/NasT family two-component response regulator
MPNQTVSLQINNIVEQAKVILKTAKSVAAPQAWNLLQLAVADVIQQIQITHPELKGSDKKEIAMNAVSSFYDQVFLVVEFPFVPQLLQPIIQRYVKQLLMILVGASIDAMVTTFRNTGVFSSVTVDKNVDTNPKVSDK